MGFEGGIAFGLAADEASGLTREIVEGAHQSVEALADLGRVDWGRVDDCEAGCWIKRAHSVVVHALRFIPKVFVVEGFEWVEEFEGGAAEDRGQFPQFLQQGEPIGISGTGN